MQLSMLLIFRKELRDHRNLHVNRNDHTNAISKRTVFETTWFPIQKKIKIPGIENNFCQSKSIDEPGCILGEYISQLNLI